MNANNNLWLFPTIQYKLAETVSEIGEGFSCCLVLFPPLDGYDFSEALLKKMLREEIIAQPVHLSAVSEISARHLSSEAFGIVGGYASLQDVLGDDSVPAVTVFLGFDKLDQNKQGKVIAILNEWIELQHAGIQKSFCVLANGESIPVLQSLHLEPKLKTKLLIGIPSAAEIQVYLRLTNGWANELDTKWYEMLLSSLAGNDLELIQHLSARPLNNFSEIVQSLAQFLTLKLWKTAEIEKEIAGWKPNPSSQPIHFRTIRNSHLLSKQLCLFQPEHGEEIHPAVLVALKREDELRHRVWRFQAALVLPLIDQIRQKLFFLLKNRIHQIWNDDIPEIGQLKFAIGDLGREHLIRQTYYEPVQQAAYIRNKLAHLDTISKSEYESVFRFWQKIVLQDVPRN